MRAGQRTVALLATLVVALWERTQSLRRILRRRRRRRWRRPMRHLMPRRTPRRTPRLRRPRSAPRLGCLAKSGRQESGFPVPRLPLGRRSRSGRAVMERPLWRGDRTRGRHHGQGGRGVPDAVDQGSRVADRQGFPAGDAAVRVPDRSADRRPHCLHQVPERRGRTRSRERRLVSATYS